MLEETDLTLKLTKEEYEKKAKTIHPKMYTLQRVAKEAQIPTILIFEGWDTAGKGTCISSFIEWLDPRIFKVHPTYAPVPDELLRPFLWRFWLKIPNYGEMTIFDRSWYGRVLVERIEKFVSKEIWQKGYEEIRQFERQLADDGYVILKFWLHISKKEQAKRFKKCLNDPLSKWKISDNDIKQHKKYKKYYKAVEEMLVKTDAPYAPWTVVEATCSRFSRIKIARKIVETIETKIKEKKPELLEALAVQPQEEKTEAQKVEKSENTGKKTTVKKAGLSRQ